MAGEPRKRRARVTGGVPVAAPADAPSGEASVAGARDLMFVGQSSESGKGYEVVRRRQDRVEVGELRALEHGRAIHGEVVRLHHRPEHERLFDVEVLLDAQAPSTTETRPSGGPAQVATRAYREQWDAIFGGKRSSPN